MSNLWIILAVWICLNLAFIVIRLLVTAQSDEQPGRGECLAEWLSATLKSEFVLHTFLRCKATNVRLRQPPRRLSARQ